MILVLPRRTQMCQNGFAFCRWLTGKVEQKARVAVFAIDQDVCVKILLPYI